MPRANIHFRWVPAVKRQPHLEYGLWKTRAQATQAARDIAFIRCTPDAPVSAYKVHYRIER